MSEHSVFFIKLISGENILSGIEKIDNGVLLISPLEVCDDTDEEGTLMAGKHWFPALAMGVSEIEVHYEHVICMSLATDDMFDFYNNCQEKFKQRMEEGMESKVVH